MIFASRAGFSPARDLLFAHFSEQQLPRAQTRDAGLPGNLSCVIEFRNRDTPQTSISGGECTYGV